jgi:hypothetical protein
MRDNPAMTAQHAESPWMRSGRRLQLVRAACVVLALAYAVPIAWRAYERLIDVNRKARAQLITHHRLWELQPEFRGKPEVWTRMASHLLNDRQLLSRVEKKYGPQAAEIEIEYRRDLTIARAEVVVVAAAVWAAPVAALYGIALLAQRRRKAPAPRTEPASISDPRYLPPNGG